MPKIAEKKTAEKLDTPNRLYAIAINQNGRGGFSQDGLPPRVTFQRLPEL